MDWFSYLDGATEEPIWGLVALDFFYKQTAVSTSLGRKQFVDDLFERYVVRATPSEHVVRGLIGMAFQLLTTDGDYMNDLCSRILRTSPAWQSVVAVELEKIGRQLDIGLPGDVAKGAPMQGSKPPGEPKSGRRSRPGRAGLGCDFGVVTPLGVEFDAAEQIFGPLTILKAGAGDAPTVYKGHSVGGLSLAIIQCAAKGQQHAASAAEFIAVNVPVRGFILAGVAGSLRRSLKAGDVAFIFGGFDDRLSRDARSGHETEALSLPQVPVSASLALADWLHTLSRDDSTAQAQFEHRGNVFHVDSSGTSSTNTVVDSPDSPYRSSIAGPGRNQSKIVEMEFVGFLEGIQKVYGRRLVPTAHIRGISDSASRKNKRSQSMAAVHAMVCLNEWLAYWAEREKSLLRSPGRR